MLGVLIDTCPNLECPSTGVVTKLFPDLHSNFKMSIELHPRTTPSRTSSAAAGGVTAARESASGTGPTGGAATSLRPLNRDDDWMDFVGAKKFSFHEPWHLLQNDTSSGHEMLALNFNYRPPTLCFNIPVMLLELIGLALKMLQSKRNPKSIISFRARTAPSTR